MYWHFVINKNRCVTACESHKQYQICYYLVCIDTFEYKRLYLVNVPI